MEEKSTKKNGRPKKIRDTVEVKKKTGKPGRPKGTRKQRQFEQTR